MSGHLPWQSVIAFFFNPQFTIFDKMQVSMLVNGLVSPARFSLQKQRVEVNYFDKRL